MLKHVKGKNLTVLDVGCATGANGRFLLDNKIADKVYGLELDQEMAGVAERLYRQVVVGDLDDLYVEEVFETNSFDYIIAGDVLEHLKDPWRVLEGLVKLLKPDGRIILSIPNIQHIDVFIHLYFKGVWPHNDRGLFDKTHLRFFTLKTMKELVSGSGLQPETIVRKYRRRDRSKYKFKHSPLEAFLKLIFRNIYTFQYVFVCKKQ